MERDNLLSTKEILWDWFDEVKDKLFTDTKEPVLRLMKRLLEDSFEIARDEYMEVERYKHFEGRNDSRNGYYTRSWQTQIGFIEMLRVPRCRKKGLAKDILIRYKDNEKSLQNLVRDMFFAGVSTNRVGEILYPIIGKRISRQTVSTIVAKLDVEVQSYHARRLEEPYLYLFFDGIVINGKDALGAKKRLVLAVYGIKKNGERELIDFMLADSESYNAWRGLIYDLKERGLRIERLIITDGAKGLHKALIELYPRVKRQRCWVHKLRNMAIYMRKSIVSACLSEAKMLYLAKTKRQAAKRFTAWKLRWQKEAPKAVACLERDIEEMLNIFDCPEEHRVKIRTTNVIERVFREVRRRVRPMNCFTNDASCERIMFGLFTYYNQKYKQRLLQVIMLTPEKLLKTA